MTTDDVTSEDTNGGENDHRLIEWALYRWEFGWALICLGLAKFFLDERIWWYIALDGWWKVLFQLHWVHPVDRVLEVVTGIPHATLFIAQRYVEAVPGHALISAFFIVSGTGFLMHARWHS